MVVARGERITLANFASGAFELRWTSFEDFDLLAAYEGARRGVIHFSNVGSLTEEPYLKLEDEVDLTSTDKDNEQRIVVPQMKVKTIWLFAWSFEHMLENASLYFKASGLHLEIQSGLMSWKTEPTDLTKGNLCRLGVLYRDDDGQLWFENHSEVFTTSAFQSIEELFAFLS